MLKNLSLLYSVEVANFKGGPIIATIRQNVAGNLFYCSFFRHLRQFDEKKIAELSKLHII